MEVLKERLKSFETMDEAKECIEKCKEKWVGPIGFIQDEVTGKFDVYILEYPELMNSSRKRRISQGSGIPMHDINLYINQFDQMRKMMKGMSDMKSMFGKMGGKLGQQGAGMLAMQQMRKNMRRFK